MGGAAELGACANAPVQSRTPDARVTASVDVRADTRLSFESYGLLLSTPSRRRTLSARDSPAEHQRAYHREVERKAGGRANDERQQRCLTQREREPEAEREHADVHDETAGLHGGVADELRSTPRRAMLRERDRAVQNPGDDDHAAHGHRARGRDGP